MATKNKVLEILLSHPEEYISGEEMANELHVSRTSIWKAIHELKKMGHQIESTTNKGYFYIPSDILSIEGVLHDLKSFVPHLEIQLLQETDSTNKELKLEAIHHAPNHSIKITNHQTATKGRFNRPYFAQEGKGIYFSILIYPQSFLIDDPTQFTLLAAVATLQAIEKLTDRSVSIKWVNDLYSNGKKICGILSEAIADMETQTISAVIIGIGINFSIKQSDFPDEIQKKATSLFPEGNPTISRNQLIAEILNQFYDLLLNGKDYLKSYRQHSFVLGKRVSYLQQGTQQNGIASAIGNKGELLVTLEDGTIQKLHSGEISLSSIE